MRWKGPKAPDNLTCMYCAKELRVINHGIDDKWVWAESIPCTCNGRPVAWSRRRTKEANDEDTRKLRALAEAARERQ